MKIQPTANSNVTIYLDGDEIATAIDAYLVTQRVYVFGPRTITTNDTILSGVKGEVIVNGTVISDGGRIGQGHHVYFASAGGGGSSLAPYHASGGGSAGSVGHVTNGSHAGGASAGAGEIKAKRGNWTREKILEAADAEVGPWVTDPEYDRIRNEMLNAPATSNA